MRHGAKFGSAVCFGGLDLGARWVWGSVGFGGSLDFWLSFFLGILTRLEFELFEWKNI